MGAPQTLHDFVLNLLTNPDARSAFEIDPEGALREAGLADISVADVRDVVPLVVDYAPVHGLTSFVSTATDASLGQPDLTPGAVISELQQVAQQLTAGAQQAAADANAVALGAITADPAGFGAVLPGLSAPLSPVDPATDPIDLDVADSLDGGPAAPVVAEPTVPSVVGVGGAVDGDPAVAGPVGVTDPLSGTLGQVTGLIDSLGVTDTVRGVGESLGLGDPVRGLGDTLDEVGGSLELGSLGGAQDGTVVGGVTSTVSGLTEQLGNTLHSATSGLVGNGPAGDADASTSGGLLGITDDLL